MAAKKISATTPIGRTEWFSLTKEDKFSNYTSTLILDDSPETHALISIIDSVGEGRKPYEKQADGSFKLKMKGKSKGSKKDGTSYVINPPVLYNAMGKKIEGQALHELNVGNGSEMRCNLEFSNYTMVNEEQEVLTGVSCKVKSVQIAKVVEFQSDNSDAGFGALEMAIESDESGPVNKPASDYDF